MSKPREVQLVSRPVGWPTPENFALVESAPTDLAEGQIRVRNEVMSVDPYMRGRMSDAKSYAAPYALGEAMHGGAVGEVVESRAEGIAVGDHVLHGLGWREEAVLDATSARVVDTSVAPASAYLGVLGMTGLTAYAGLTRSRSSPRATSSSSPGRRAPSAAPSARSPRRSVRAASSAARAPTRRSATCSSDLGFDAAFNYKDGRVSDLLRAAAPDGIDVYFDNVGGDHLEAAIGSLRLGGRIAICGAISVYNDTEAAPGPRNLARLIQTAARSRASSSATTTTWRASTPARRPAGSPTAH